MLKKIFFDCKRIRIVFYAQMPEVEVQTFWYRKALESFWPHVQSRLYFQSFCEIQIAHPCSERPAGLQEAATRGEKDPVLLSGLRSFLAALSKTPTDRLWWADQLHWCVVDGWESVKETCSVCLEGATWHSVRISCQLTTKGLARCKCNNICA